MPVILEKGNTDVGLRAGEFIQKNRQMALQQALAAQEAQRDIARMAIQREQALQQQRYQMDQALREDARAAADLQYRYDALGQSKTLAEMERDTRLGESAASRAQALRLAEMGELGADRRADRAERGEERRFTDAQKAREMARDEARGMKFDERRAKMADDGYTGLEDAQTNADLDAIAMSQKEMVENKRAKRAREMSAALEKIKRDEDLIKWTEQKDREARFDAEKAGVGPIPDNATTGGVLRLTATVNQNREQVAAAQKVYKDLQKELLDYTSRFDASRTPDATQSDIIRQLNEESKEALKHLNWLKQTIQTGGGGAAQPRTTWMDLAKQTWPSLSPGSDQAAKALFADQYNKALLFVP